MSNEKSSKKPTSSIDPNLKRLILVSVHLACLAVYLIPILTHKYPGTPVLDEFHIASDDNKDVLGTSSLKDVFMNDYWGRGMNTDSSHKSWRPLTILSFRWLKGGGFFGYTLTTHRIVNALAHAATGECVSILAVRIFSHLPSSQSLFLQCLVKLLFCLHPTHVEVTANAANRPHLFAVLVSVVLCDPQLHILTVMVMQIVGLLCSETFIFQMPAVCITLTLIQWRQTSKGDNTLSTLFSSLVTLLPRHFLLFVMSISYLVFRHFMDWLSIPEGLIRPAENPFFPLTGSARVRNYAYVTAIHLFKSWNLDFIGFSHEYGFECIRRLSKWTDPRFGVVLLTVAIMMYAMKKCSNSMHAVGLLLFHVSWMITLFPISGIVKVGTFIADRIVVASTVSVSILAGYYMMEWMMTTTTTSTPQKKGSNKQLSVHPLKTTVIVGLLSFMWWRVHHRSLDWMDSYPLLASSLRTCPRSAKSHLEISKVYSGLDPALFDLDRSLYHLEMAESIDATYCDVHQQFYSIFIQQQRLLEFEERLAKAIVCPFSMHGASEMWQRYWPVLLKDGEGGDAKARMQYYQSKIEAAVEQETAAVAQGKPQWMGATLDLEDKEDKL